MINLHEQYLGVVEYCLNINKLDATHQPEGSKPSGVIYGMLKGTTKPSVIIAYAFEPQHVIFNVVTREMGRGFDNTVRYVEGVEGFVGELHKFISAGLLPAPKK